jgi:Nickel responsive protein SCO4226-like
MSSDALTLPCYLVEWYSPEVTAGQLDHIAAKLEDCAAAMRDEGTSVRLLMTLAVPTDEVLYGVFAAPSAKTVSETCRRAGIPADRLTKAVDALITGKG